MFISKANDAVHEDAHSKFQAEASSLGMKPGEWPQRLSTDLGNSMDLIKSAECGPDGELLWVLYIQVAGCISLKIFND